MKITNELLMGVAIGVGVALLMSHNKGGGQIGPIKTLPGKTSGTMPPAALGVVRRRRTIRMQGYNYIEQPGYPMPGWQVR